MKSSWHKQTKNYKVSMIITDSLFVKKTSIIIIHWKQTDELAHQSLISIYNTRIWARNVCKGCGQ